MASSSLGTLTLDLAVRLSEFTDGLTRAERETRDSTGRISGSVRGMRNNIEDDISKISGSLIGMTVGAVAVAGAGMAAMAIETAKADVQLSIMAGTANASLKSFQILTHAAAGFGVEQEALAAILADTQEKLGEFSATGGGGAADFFEALQNNTKMTDEEIRNLGKTLQGKDGVEAIQLLKDKMDELGATSQEQRFMFESLAGDLGNLMPLFADGGRILEEYGVQLTDAGVIKTAEAIEQSRILAAQTQAMETQFEGLKTQLVASTIPAMSTLITYFQEGSKKGRGFQNEVNGVGEAVRVTTGLIIGLAASVSVIAKAFQTVGAQMRAIGQTFTNFVEADGVIAKSKALIGGTITSAGLMAVGMRSVSDEYDRAVRAFEASSATQRSQLTGLAAIQYDANTFLQSNTSGLKLNTVEAEANTKAEEARAKALEKTTKAAGRAAKAQERLVGISGDTGIGSAHLHIQYRDKSRAVSQSDMDRFRAGGKKITDYRKTSDYGPRNTGIKGASTNHRGTDFAIPKNTPITTNVAVKGVKTWHDSKGGGYVSTITFEDGVVIDLLHQMPSVMGVDKGASTGNKSMDAALARADSMAQKAAADALRAEQELQRQQMSIISQYATDKEKIELEHANNVVEIKKAYAEGTTEYAEYMAREEVRYNESKHAAMLSIAEKYMSEEQQIHDKHQKALKQIEAANIEDDTTRQMFIDVQNAMYQKDLDNFKFASQAKAREQDKLYQSIADSMKANRLGAASTGLDAMAQRTMSDDDYAVWRLAQDRDEAFNSVNSQYKDRQSEINARDERGEFQLPELERFELLEAAKQEHMDAMWAMEQDYATKEQQLNEQLQNAKLQNYGNTLGAMAGLLGSFAGENNRISQMMFAAQKGYALAQIYLNNEVALSEAWASAPFPYNMGAVATAALETGALAAAAQAITPSFSGIAHGGLDYVPKESTYLLDKGERVLSPKQNKDFTSFINNGGSSGGDVNINVVVDAKGNAQVSGDNERMGRDMANGIKAVVMDVMRKEKRQGGMLYG